MDRHAYLIMAHGQPEQLKLLLSCLDHPRNDIFIHLDKKAAFSPESLRAAVKSARCFFTRRIRVSWGGYSIVEAELILLRAAVEQGKHCYYHFLSGADLPLRSQTRIHAFFDGCGGKEFISCTTQVGADYVERVRLYYPFRDLFGRNSLPGRVLHKGGTVLQKLLGVDRLRGKGVQLGLGSQFFSITHAMAQYVLSREAFIRSIFRMGFCTDELFLQTVYLNSPFARQDVRYRWEGADHPYIHREYLDILRAIDWTRGRPYTYTGEDYEMLMASGCLFARKFDLAADPALVGRIVEAVKE